ncbi:MAG: DUF3794 domain-containing protein [Acetobacter sp.]|nr:DUF3794 domain-containing protein [Acetobacter sp.]
MTFESNNFNVVRKTRLPKGEFNVECNIQVASPASKILTVSAEASVSSYEVLSGSINYAGSIDARIVYLTEEGEICTVASSCPFSSKFDSESITSGQKAIISVKVVDHDIESLTADNIRLICNIEQSGVLVSTNEIQSISSDSPEVCCKSEEMEIIRFVGDATETATVNSEIVVRQPIKKLILTESQALVRSVESGVNFVSVSGEVVSRVLYLTEDDKFETGYIYDGFKEELELEGATRDSQVEAYAFVRSENVRTDIEESDKGIKISIEVPVVLAVKVYENATVNVIKDLYSTTNEIKVSTESFDMTVVCPMEIVESKIDGSLTLDDENPRVDKILFVGGNNVVVSNSFIRDGEINIEGIATTTVVYLNDEANSLNSVQIDVPFVLTDKWNNESEDGILVVDASICDVDVVVKKGREFYYDAKVKACVNYCHNVVSGVITHAEELEAYPEKDYGMELLFARAGQDAWDIAKEAGVKEDMLIMQNPEIMFPLEEDRNLILFYQKQN